MARRKVAPYARLRRSASPRRVGPQLAEAIGIDAPHLLTYYSYRGIMKYRNISWHEIDTGVEAVGRTIRAARFRPDCIVAILKGGLVPARLLSDFFGSIEIYPIRVKAYAGTRKLARIRLESFRYPIGRKSVLLVDDIHDSGQTLQKVIRYLHRRRPRALRTASLFYKHNALHPPDFHARTVAPDVWVVFPWERNEMKNARITRMQKIRNPNIVMP